MKKRLSLVLALVMMVSVFTGCGGGGSASGSSGVEVPKTLNISMSENATSLDPHNQSTLAGKVFCAMHYECPLIYVDEIGDYIPWLCESYEYSDNYLEWTFKLREGITFSNGEPMNADDWVCTFQRIIDGQGELAIAIQHWNTLESVEKIDEYTVKLTTSEPLSTIKVGLAKTFIIPDGAFGEMGEDLFTNQICTGTGPWVLDVWLDGQYAHFNKNENYWNKSFFDSYYNDVYIHCITEPSTAVAAHLAGDIDAFISSGGINPDMLPLYEGTENEIEIVNFLSGTYDYLGLSFKDGSPFLDENVRWALEYAIDRQALVDNILGEGFVPNSQVLNNTYGYDETIPPYEYDPVKAKEYLDKSSYDGREIVLSTNVATMKGEDILLAVSENLNAIGFNTTVEVVETATLNAMRNTGEYDVFLVSNMQSYNDPGAEFTNRVMNDVHHSFYVNDELNALIAEQNRELDGEKRIELIQQISRMMRENAAPHSFLTQRYVNHAVDWGITGLELFVDGTYRFSFATYDPDAHGNSAPDFSAYYEN